ncbi:Protein of unknown function [Peptoclostridium litorale DSM 5388]|uniref:Uncharacterized protein n=1 Tax=Peptoclostridium litorale DSM 5388 TaxID=1121324 RepID=A0A069RHI5_PEPLI|nr:DUF1292 domain-containing protein [Peptoclostridium litorale]KDR96248.1 hypothetical protein CLIT_4c00850 [Peptoclostridium litorale DSM 5388]SIO14433.1 Protein of unknown function [Peptoclostridium litorale DSM 5388]
MEEKNMVILKDENGNDVEFELVEELEMEGVVYVLLADPGDEDDAYVYRKIEEDGKFRYEAVEDEDEFERVVEEYDSYFDEE